MPSPSKQQQDINRRLNDLLNKKDQEIIDLTEQLLKQRTEQQAVSVPAGNAKSFNPLVTELQNQIAMLERENKEVKTELAAVSRVNRIQGEELESLNAATDVGQNLREQFEELKLTRDQNRLLKTRLHDEEKKGREAHAKMVQMELTIRQLQQANKQIKAEQRRNN